MISHAARYAIGDVQSLSHTATIASKKRRERTWRSSRLVHPREIRTPDLRITNADDQTGQEDPKPDNSGPEQDMQNGARGQYDPDQDSSEPKCGPNVAPVQDQAAPCDKLPPDLAQLTAIWPSLSEPTRQAILTLAEGARRE